MQKVNTEDAVEIGEIPDILDLAHLWEWAGVSLGQQNTFLLLLSIKRLVEEKSLKSVRLWGKIIGTEGNYIVAEGELKDGAQDDEDPTAKKQAEQQASTVVDDKQKPIVTLSRELRQGTNKYVYYVCAHVGAPWTRLGDVIPEQLQASRRIHKYMTGRLEAPVNSYPAFPGNESDLLRCVIARISAGTVMSPNGYYIVDGDEEVEEGQVANIIINPEFEGISNEQMVNLSNWTHHVPYVLPQGRTVWQNPVHKAEGDEEEEQDEENEGPEPEVGPPMLSPAVNDEGALC